MEEDGKGHRGKKGRRFILLLILICAIAGGFYSFTRYSEAPRRDLVIYGNVDIRQIQLAFHATGRIQQLLVQEGDSVKMDQLVGEIDPIRYEAAVAQANAEVATQKQNLARLLAGSRPEEIEEAQARVKAAEATFRDAQAGYQRAKALVQDEYTSRQKVDDAEAAFLAAKANLDGARQGGDFLGDFGVNKN